MKDNTKNNTLLLTVIGVATLLVAVVGATFAYFTAAMNPGESEATVKVNAGQLKINFANTNAVQIADQVQPTAATCDELKPADFDKVFHIMELSFPEDEFRTYEEQKALLENSYYQIYILPDESGENIKAFVEARNEYYLEKN